MVSSNRPYKGIVVNLPPVGTRMCMSCGTCYKIVEYDDYESVIVVVLYGKSDSRLRWHISTLKLDTILTPLMETLI
jgi:hypothetical protein